MLPCPLQHLYLCAAWLGAPCLQREAFTIMCEEGLSLYQPKLLRARSQTKLDPIAVPGPEKVKTSEQEQR